MSTVPTNQKKTASIPRSQSPVTLEFFTWFLQTLTEDMALIPSWRGERPRQKIDAWPQWLQESIPDAWQELRTDENRKQALWLLAKAKGDVLLENLADPQLRKKMRKQSSALQKAHRQLEQHGTALLKALAVYKAQIKIVPFSEPPASPSSVRDITAYFQAQMDWPMEMEKFASQIVQFFDRLREFRQYRSTRALKPGRKKKDNLNTAIVGLYDMLNKKLSANHRVELVHALLYASRLWRNKEADGLRAKLSGLLK
jgi:hypothetical protein